MNSKFFDPILFSITSSPPPRQLASILGTALLWYLRPRINSICKGLYPANPPAVDKELCESILRDSLDPGAINVMISGSKLPPPRTANELLGADFGYLKTNPKSLMKGIREGRFTGPVLVAQGILDPLNDASSRAKMLGDLRNGITVTPLHAGHCPHGKEISYYELHNYKINMETQRLEPVPSLLHR